MFYSKSDISLLTPRWTSQSLHFWSLFFSLRRSCKWFIFDGVKICSKCLSCRSFSRQSESQGAFTKEAILELSDLYVRAINHLWPVFWFRSIVCLLSDWRNAILHNLIKIERKSILLFTVYQNELTFRWIFFIATKILRN